MATGDAEPAYAGSGHYGGNEGQQLRERSYATFLEGGTYINYGDEDWWPFGAQGLYSEGLAWRDVPSDSHTIQQSYVWSLIDEYVADATWEPTLVRDDGRGLGRRQVSLGPPPIAVLPSRTCVSPTFVDHVLGGPSGSAARPDRRHLHHVEQRSTRGRPGGDPGDRRRRHAGPRRRLAEPRRKAVAVRRHQVVPARRALLPIRSAADSPPLATRSCAGFRDS